MEHRNYHEMDPSKGAFAEGLRWEWRRKDTVPASSEEDFKKWQESASSTERREFEEWRAWQEWKRKNPK